MKISTICSAVSGASTYVVLSKLVGCVSDQNLLVKSGMFIMKASVSLAAAGYSLKITELIEEHVKDAIVKAVMKETQDQESSEDEEEDIDDE